MDPEFKKFVSEFSLNEVESALKSIDAESFPERHQILIERRMEIIKEEKAIFERFSEVEKLPINIKVISKDYNPVKIKIGQYEIERWKRQFNIKLNGVDYLKISGSNLTDVNGNRIGNVALHNGIDSDIFEVQVKVDGKEYLAIRKSKWNDIISLLGGRRTYLIRTDKDLLGDINIESFGNQSVAIGTYYSTATPDLWFIGFFIATQVQYYEDLG